MSRHSHFSSLIGILLASVIASMVFVPSVSALSIGVQFNNYDPGEAAVVKLAGAQVYRMHVDYRQTSSADVNGGWGAFETAVEAAWKQGIPVLPILERSVLNGQGEEEWRFLTSEEATAWNEWRRWTKAAVERFGVNGKFWEGKSNPTPVTAWEVWNEPNLPANNPVLSKSQCTALGKTFYEESNTCVQPRNYGKFLSWTSGALQEGSKAKTGGETTVLFAGIFMPFSNEANNENYRTYLEQANQETNVPQSYSGLAIHPYGLANGKSQVIEQVWSPKRP